jgi:MFS family permease
MQAAISRAGGSGERPEGLDARSALRFVIAFGVVSLFADMTYEGMRSISGPFLASLAATGTIVGLVAGTGESLGYGLRWAAGELADRSGRYWPITLAGYGMQMFAVPALALAGSWPAAAALIILERIGKALRSPPRSLMLSRAGEHVGQGWAFGLHEALDQTGAVLGPLIAAGVLALRHDYHSAFAWLLAPATATVLCVLTIRFRYPQAGRLPGPGAPQADGAPPLPAVFRLYALGASLVAFGFADYALISYHFVRASTVPAAWVPVFYAAAMAAAGAGSLVYGRLFDRYGLIVLVPATLLVALYPVLVFGGGAPLALTGTLLWGFGVGVHETVASAAVSGMAPARWRARAYGIFAALFGLSWVAGSVALGALYDASLTATVAVAVGAQLCALVPITLAWRRMRSD